MLGKTRESLHLPGLKFLLIRGLRVPGRNFLRTLCQFCVRWNNAHLFLAGIDLFPKLIPSPIKLVLVTVNVLLGHMMRRMQCTGGKVDEERLVRRQRVLRLHPGNRLVSHVDGKMVIRGVRWLYSNGSIENGGGPLVGLTTNETVKLVKAGMRWPTVKRS